MLRHLLHLIYSNGSCLCYRQIPFRIKSPPVLDHFICLLAQCFPANTDGAAEPKALFFVPFSSQV